MFVHKINSLTLQLLDQVYQSQKTQNQTNKCGANNRINRVVVLMLLHIRVHGPRQRGAAPVSSPLTLPPDDPVKNFVISQSAVLSTHGPS